MSLISPISNSISFKKEGGNYPNKWNRLHSDRNQGAWTILDYCQKFPNGHNCYLQFVSNSDFTVPTMIVYFKNGTTDTIIGTLADSVTGDQIRHWFNFVIPFGANYYNQQISIKVTQGSNILTSEPVYIYDMFDDIENGVMRYFKYSNLDRNIADLDGYFVKWDKIDNTGNYMDFFVEATDRESENKYSNAILEGSQSRSIIASRLYSGIKFATGIIPDYMCLKLTSVIGLDVVYMNDIQYVIDGDPEQSIVGGSTSDTYVVSLIEKNTLGINVDNLGIENTDMSEWHKSDRNATATSDFTSIEPVGYSLLAIRARQTGVPTIGYITVLFGYSSGANDIGQMRIYSSGKISNLDVNRRNDFNTASTIYITIPSQAGSNLDIRFNYQLEDID